MKKLDKRGFTIPEALIGFLLISLVVVWVTTALPGVRNMSNVENHRLIAIMRNIDIVESTRYEVISTGNIRQFSPSELTGSEYGSGILYTTVYEKFESSKDENSDLYKIMEKVLDETKYPEFAELKPRAGSNSELYRVTVNTIIAREKWDNTRLTTFIYRGGN